MNKRPRIGKALTDQDTHFVSNVAIGLRRTERGLSAAVVSLVVGMWCRRDVDVGAERWPPDLEANAYFVICEALTNVAKLARASRARVRGCRVAGGVSSRSRTTSAERTSLGGPARAGSGTGSPARSRSFHPHRPGWQDARKAPAQQCVR
jgi:hypothetical protein